MKTWRRLLAAVVWLNLTSAIGKGESYSTKAITLVVTAAPGIANDKIRARGLSRILAQQGAGIGAHGMGDRRPHRRPSLRVREPFRPWKRISTAHPMSR